MGLTKDSGQVGRVSFCKVRMGKEGEDPTIQLTDKVDGEWKVVETFFEAKGTIKSVKTDEHTHDKFGKFRSVIITLDEPMEDPVQLEVPVQWSTIGFLNSLLSCSLGDFIIVQPGYRKRKDSGLAKTIWLTDSEKKVVEWAYNIDDLPEVKVVELKGQRMVDDELRLDWFMAKINEKFSTATEPAAEEKPEPATSPAADDDLPF